MPRPCLHNETRPFNCFMPSVTPRARVVFEEIKTHENPFEFLQQIASGTDPNLNDLWQESEWLDYKEAAWVNAPASSDKNSCVKCSKEESVDYRVKTTWSENLAAFSNTSGGVLIFGAKTDGRFPIKQSLARDAPALARRLKELQNNAIDPPVLGVEVESFTAGVNSTEGFVVCYIPPSDFAPHRALWASREFYMRVNDSNIMMPLSHLRRMFYPISAPRLAPFITKAQMQGNSDDTFSLHMTVDLQNKGTASAEEVCIKVGGPYNPFIEMYCWESSKSIGNAYVCTNTIHPSQSIRLFHNLVSKSRLKHWPTAPIAFEVSFTIFAKNTQATHCVVRFTDAELKESQENGKPIEREGRPELF